MKNSIIAGILAVMLSFPLSVSAQTVSDPSSTSLNAIEKITGDSLSNISIDIPDDILNLLISEPKAPVRQVVTRKQTTLKPGINHIKGYRVQVFADGRNQNTLESRVKMRANAISARFPKYRGQVYTFSNSPNWYCRVGNFQTQQEAQAALRELKAAFPAFAGEMRIVNSQIVVIR